MGYDGCRFFSLEEEKINCVTYCKKNFLRTNREREARKSRGKLVVGSIK